MVSSRVHFPHNSCRTVWAVQHTGQWSQDDEDWPHWSAAPCTPHAHSAHAGRWGKYQVWNSAVCNPQLHFTSFWSNFKKPPAAPSSLVCWCAKIKLRTEGKRWCSSCWSYTPGGGFDGNVLWSKLNAPPDTAVRQHSVFKSGPGWESSGDKWSSMACNYWLIASSLFAQKSAGWWQEVSTSFQRDGRILRVIASVERSHPF